MGFAIDLGLFFLTHPYLITFLAAVFLEESIIFFAFLSGSGLISFYAVYIFGIFGAIIGDICWYFIGKSSLVEFLRQKCKRLKYVKRQYHRTSKLVHRIAGNKIFLSLFFSKFVFGSRILMMLYFGAKKVKFSKYVIYDVISIIIWTSVLAPIGWLAGRGIVSSFGVISRIRHFVTIGIILVLAFYILSEFIVRKLLHEKS